MLKKFKDIFLGFSLMVLSLSMVIGLTSSVPVVAQNRTLTPGNDKICPGGNCPLIGSKGAGNIDIVNVLISIARFLTFIGVALAILFMVWGGILYITSNGSERAESAKKTIINAAIGLVVAIIAYTIVSLLANVLQTDYSSSIGL